MPAGPVTEAVPSEEYRCGTCLVSQASTCCGLPGASHQPALSTRSGVPGIWIAVLSAPWPADGAVATLVAPDGTANEARMAAASASARCCGPAAGRGNGRVAGVLVPVAGALVPIDPVGWPTGCGTAQPASAMAATAPRTAPAASGGAAWPQGRGCWGWARPALDRRDS